MPPIFDLPHDLAHNWYGLGTWVVIAIAAVIAIRAIFQVKYQVKNSHSSNLRDDLDEKFASLAAQVEGVKSTLEDHGDRLNSIDEHLRKG